MMKTKTNLTKKITAYSAVAGTIIAIAPNVNAQIVYTDVDPDSTINAFNTFYDLDLNNDAIVDFKINLYQVSSSWGTGSYSFRSVNIWPQNNNQAADNPDTLNLNDTINSNLNWLQGQNVLAYWQTYYNTSTGTIYSGGYDFLNTNNKYLGLRIVVGSDTLYGWARLDVDSTSSSFTIKDYAYNVTPKESILAGQTTLVSVKETDINKNVSVYSFGKKVYINTNKNKGTITILNSLGQIVANFSIRDSQTIINVAHIKSGIYFVRIQMNEGIITKKVFIE